MPNFHVQGAILAKWESCGGSGGFLGEPTTDELITPGGRGRYNHFEGGSIYWTPEYGAFEIHGLIRGKWAELSWEQGLLGFPLTDELTTPDGRGRYNHFEGGSIYWTPEWGAFEVHGLIRQKWADLGWEQGFPGFPVTDELSMPDGSGGRYNVFEHGVVTWFPGQAHATAEPHHYERIYARLRAHILSRFFAIGPEGRRNHLSFENALQGPVPTNPNTPDEKRAAEQARWRIVSSHGENPFMVGALLNIALAVEHEAGSVESTRALEASLATLESLFQWQDVGHEDAARLPKRWDAGIPTDGVPELERFLDNGHGSYSDSLASTSIHHYLRRDPVVMAKLLGATAATSYGDQHHEFWNRYRVWELSTDELTGLVTSLWAIGKLARSENVAVSARRCASFLGNYLANNAYLLVRPMGGLSYRGSTGMLPTLQFPFSRALGSVTGEDYSPRTDFAGAMRKAGYWGVLDGPVTAGRVAGAVLGALLPLLNPLALSLGVTIAAFEGFFAGQALSPGTVGAALGLIGCTECFDINEPGEPVLALLGLEAPNKAKLYRTVTTAQAAIANSHMFSVNFHGWIGLTGLDDQDPTVRDTFRDWFNLRQFRGDLEPKGVGSRLLFSSGVAAILENDSISEGRLVGLLERAIVELFRDCYFEPRLPVIELPPESREKNPVRERGWFPHWDYEGNPGTPYSPLDFLGAMALAFWHAKRRRDGGNPVATARFPQPLSPERFSLWPKASVPTDCLPVFGEMGIPVQAIQGTDQPAGDGNGYPLFESPPVARRMAPVPPPRPAATMLTCDVTIPVRAVDPGDITTGVTIFPGHEFQIDATGQIWAGVFLDSANSPDGQPRPVNDTQWPLHTGIDPAANEFCLLGRLNGYFRIGSGMARTPWLYHGPRPLYLRINDGGPGDGNGQFDVRIRVWSPEGTDPATVFLPRNVFRDGGVLRTNDTADLIEVTVTPNAVDANEVQFELVTTGSVRWRKEIVINESPLVGSGAWTIFTDEDKRQDANGLYLYQLDGGFLTFRKAKTFGIMESVLTLGGMVEVAPGSRVTFNWAKD